MHGMEGQGLHVLREMRCGNSGSSTAVEHASAHLQRRRMDVLFLNTARMGMTVLVMPFAAVEWEASQVSQPISELRTCRERCDRTVH